MMVVMSACIAIVYLCDCFLGTRGMSLGQLLDSLSGMKLGMLELLAFGVALLVLGISCSASVAAMKNKEQKSIHIIHKILLFLNFVTNSPHHL